MILPTRRAALGLLASATVGATLGIAVAVPASAEVAASAPSTTRFRAIAVDTAAMARRGDESGAAVVAHAMARQMRAVFGDLMAPGDSGAPTLVARINSLYLTSYVGNRSYGGRGDGGSGNDNLDGAGIVRAGGRVVSETPILAVLDPGYSGAWYLPDIEELRIDAICHQFAWWLRREMGV